MRIVDLNYAAVCGSTNKEYAAVCRSSIGACSTPSGFRYLHKKDGLTLQMIENR